jgi:hypothetical protein
MKPIEVFGRYAMAFEEVVRHDDWSVVEPFFTEENPAKPLIRTASTPNRSDDAMNPLILGCPTSGLHNASMRRVAPIGFTPAGQCPP